jgi:hypothetical protein
MRIVTYEMLVQEEKNRQVAAAIFTGLAAGANAYNASQAGHGTYTTPSGRTGTFYSPAAAVIAQNNAAVQNDAMISTTVEAGQRNTARAVGNQGQHAYAVRMIRRTAAHGTTHRSGWWSKDLYDSHHGRNRSTRHRYGAGASRNMTRRGLGLAIMVCVVSTFCLERNSYADSSDCQDAISEYNSAVSDISTALRRYTNCVSSSIGHDDCSSEFRRLKSAQDDFESAVSRYGMECNRV